MEELLKPAEVAVILKISQAKAYTMLRREVMPIVRIGSLVRVRKSDLDKFIRETGNLSNPMTLPKA